MSHRQFDLDIDRAGKTNIRKFGFELPVGFDFETAQSLKEGDYVEMKSLEDGKVVSFQVQRKLLMMIGDFRIEFVDNTLSIEAMENLRAVAQEQHRFVMEEFQSKSKSLSAFFKIKDGWLFSAKT